MRACAFVVLVLSLQASHGVEVDLAQPAVEEPGSGAKRLTLAACISEAVGNNPEIRRARIDLERAAGTKLEIRSRALPHASANFRLGWRQGTLYDSDGGTSVLTAFFRQRVVDTGIPHAWRRGRIEMLVAEQRLHVAIVEQLHALRETFLRALLYRDLVRIDDEIHGRLEANVRSQEQRLEAGAASRKDVRQAEVQLLNLQPTRTWFRREYLNATVRLAELMGRDVGREVKAPVVPDGALRHQPIDVRWKEAALVARERRPDLAMLRQLIDLTEADKGVVRAEYLPLVSLVGSLVFVPEDVLLRNDTEQVAGRGSRATEYRVGADWTWQIIDNGKVTGRMRQLEAIRQSYKVQLAKLEQTIVRDLGRVAGAIENAEARLDALAKSTAQAEANLQTVVDRISVGQAAQLDYSYAQRDLLNVRRQILEATFEHERAVAELDRITGRYLEFAESEESLAP